MSPSVIPPGAALEDFVFPSESIRLSPPPYPFWEAEGFFEEMGPGSRLMVTLGLKAPARSIFSSILSSAPPSGQFTFQAAAE